MIILYLTLYLRPITTTQKPHIVHKQSFFNPKYRKHSNHANSGVNNSGVGGRFDPKGIPA